MMRSIRRHHRDRLKKKRKDYYGWGDYDYIMTPRQLGMVANTPTHCSCMCCGNPRRHWNFETRAETKSHFDYVEQCLECGIRVSGSTPKYNDGWY